VNVPLARPHPTAGGVVESAPLILLDLETDQGVTGQAYVFCYTPIALKPIADLMESLQPADSRGCGRAASPGVEAPGPFSVARVARVYRDSHGSD
jgi:hypothetical protein